MIGVETEFTQFFEALFPRACSVARRITGDAAAAEDIAAESFTRAYVRWRRLSRDPRRNAWLIRVATNLAIDYTRRKPLPRRTAEPTNPSDDAVVVRLALVGALVRLSRREREIVTLRYLADLTEADVASALGLSEGSVKTYARRGLAHLRSSLAATDDADLEAQLAITTE